MRKYIPNEIEKNGRRNGKRQTFSQTLINKALLQLMMFPYPSAEGLMSGICTPLQVVIFTTFMQCRVMMLTNVGQDGFEFIAKTMQ